MSVVDILSIFRDYYDRVDQIRILSNKRQLLGLLILVGLLIAIPLTMYLVRQQQILRSRAHETSDIHFFNLAGQEITGTPPTTTSQNVQLRLAYVASAVTPSPTPSPSPTPGQSPQGTITTPSFTPASSSTPTFVQIPWSNLNPLDTNWSIEAREVGSGGQPASQATATMWLSPTILGGPGYCVSVRVTTPPPASGNCSMYYNDGFYRNVIFALDLGRDYIFVLKHNQTEVSTTPRISYPRQ